jgi:N4-gp56 family major capsid protein
MAFTTFGVNDALAVKLWAKSLEYDIVYRTDLSSLIGSDENSVIQLKNETSKESGDQITYALMAELLGDGFTEGDIAEGNGESLSLFSDSLLINELGHVVGIPNQGRSIDAQRVHPNLREAARRGLRTWKAKRMSTTFFAHMCGYTLETRAKYNGNNTITAPTRQIWVDSTGPAVNSDDTSLVSGDQMTLAYVDYARELAESPSSGSPIRPINIVGKDGGQDISGGRYIMYLHPYQVVDLRTNTNAGQWLDIQQAALSGSASSKNPIYTDALGEYNNVILKKANHITTGVTNAGADAPNVRRAVLLGAQACALAFGKGNGPTTYAWNEELIDHKRKLEVSVMSIWGMKKMKFNSVDQSVVVVSSYAVKHTA